MQARVRVKPCLWKINSGNWREWPSTATLRRPYPLTAFHPVLRTRVPDHHTEGVSRAKQVFGPTRRRNVAIQGELRRPRRQAQPPDCPLPMAAAWHLSRHHHLVFDGIHARRLIVVKTAGTPHMAGSSTQTHSEMTRSPKKPFHLRDVTAS